MAVTPGAGLTNIYGGGSGTAGFSANLTVGIPTGGASGDRVVAAVSLNGTDAGASNPTNPAGWTELYRAGGYAGGNGGMVVIERAWVSGLAAPVWVITDSNADGAIARAEMASFIVKGATGAPAVGTPVNRSSNITTTVVPGVTTVNDAMIVVVAGDRISNQTTVTGPGSMTEIAKAIQAANGGGSIGIWYEQTPTGGATGTRTITYGVASLNAAGVMLNYSPVTGGSAPTGVSAGADREVTTGASTPLSGTATGATAVAWSILSGPDTPTISNASNLTGASVTFTVPGVYTVRLTATNSNGSTVDDVVITASATTVAPISTVSNPGGWTAVNAASLAAALGDASDSTYIESDAAGEVVTLLLGAVAAASGYTIRLRGASVPTAGQGTTVRLMQGATQIATRTVANWGDTPGDQAFALTGPEVSAITDRDDLRFEFTSTT